MTKSIFLDARLSKNSGIGRYIDSLAREFLSHPEWNYRWSFLVNEKQSFISLGERKLTTHKPFSAAWQLCAPRIIPKDSFLWTPHWNHPILVRSKMQSVVTIHDVMPLRFPQLYSKLDRFLFEKFIQTAVNREYQIITVSEFSKAEILNIFPSAIVKVIANGVTALPVGPAFIENAKPYYLCVGNLKPHKNIPFVIRAFRLAKERGSIPSNSRLVVAGSISGLRQVDVSLLGEQTLGNDILLIESPSDAKLGRLFKDCIAFIAPSLYEGFGLPILEAMHFQKPIVCSDIVVFREVAGTTVRYFELNNIEQCADAIAQASLLSSINDVNYSEILERFTWNQSAVSHHKLFTSLDS